MGVWSVVGVRYPEQAPACRFGVDGPPDVPGVVRARHRAEASEWLALFQVFRQESDRVVAGRAGCVQRDAGMVRVDAAEAACARWCVHAPATIASTRFRLRAAIQVFEHLPLVAQAFLDGVIPGQMVTRIADRTLAVDTGALPAVDAAIRGEVVQAIAEGARFSRAAIDAAVDEIVMVIDPQGVRAARRAARARIGVRTDPLPGGVARLVAVLPAVASVAVTSAVEALARRLHAGRPVDDDGDRLTLDRCRALALVALVAGRTGLAASGLDPRSREQADHTWTDHTRNGGSGGGAGGGGAGGSGVQVVVHATEEAIGRPSDAVPVWIARLGLVSSASVAALLAGARRRVPRAGPVEQLRPTDPLSWLGAPLTPPDPHLDRHPDTDTDPDPESGLSGSGLPAPEEWEPVVWEPVVRMGRDRQVAVARLLSGLVPGYAVRYPIPGWLARRVRQRDGTCRFPGCAVPAVDCDLDHLRPFDHRDPIAGGWTIETNLGCLCRRHHRLKTHDRWTITTSPDAVFTLTGPDGATAHTHPTGPASRITLTHDLHHTGHSGAGAGGSGGGGDGLDAVPDPLPPLPGEHEPDPPADLLDRWAAEDLALAHTHGWDHPDPAHQHVKRPVSADGTPR